MTSPSPSLSSSLPVTNNNNVVEDNTKQYQHRPLPTTKASSSDSVTMGVQGVHLKRFEQVVAKILPHIEPYYVKLPQISSSSTLTTTLKGDGNKGLEESSPSSSKPISLFEQPSCIPNAARVYGTGLGQLSNLQRAARKEQQVESLIQCILALLESKCHRRDATSTSRRRVVTIIDFGGGTGHLAIPLSILLLNQSSSTATETTGIDYRVVVVDLKRASLELLHRKAESCRVDSGSSNNSKQNGEREATTSSSPSTIEILPRTLQRCSGISNLFTFHGPIESFTTEENSAAASVENTEQIPDADNDHIIIGVALHVCGEATDIMIKHCACNLNAYGLVFAPCCVGKLSTNVFNPYIFQATAQNKPTIQYPQSKLVTNALLLLNNKNNDDTEETQQQQQQLQESKEEKGELRNHRSSQLVDDWNAIAKAADYSCILESKTSRNACRRVAKSLLEVDRQLYLEESFGYSTILTRMIPWEASPKNDIVVAWKDIAAAECSRSNGSANQSRPSQTTTATGQLHSPKRLLPNTQHFQFEPCSDCNADVDLVRQHLFQPQGLQISPGDTNDATKSHGPLQKVVSSLPNPQHQHQKEQQDRIDWTAEEEEDIVRRLRSFCESIDDDETTLRYVFPPKEMIKRKRKLVHYVAARLNLKSWGQGKKHSEKTVVVSRANYLKMKKQQQTAVSAAAPSL